MSAELHFTSLGAMVYRSVGQNAQFLLCGAWNSLHALKITSWNLNVMENPLFYSGMGKLEATKGGCVQELCTAGSLNFIDKIKHISPEPGNGKTEEKYMYVWPPHPSRWVGGLLSVCIHIYCMNMCLSCRRLSEEPISCSRLRRNPRIHPDCLTLFVRSTSQLQ